MQFAEGDLLKAIYFENEQAIRVGDECDSIIVSMESGQMSYVPWFEVWKDGKCISKWNAAQVEGVCFA